MKWIIILLMAFFYIACGGEDEETTGDPTETPTENEDDNDNDNDEDVDPPIAQSAINPNVLICEKEDKTLTFELKQYSAGSTECDLENSKCKTACGCELTLNDGEKNEILLCSNSAESDHCSQGFEQVKQGVDLTGNTASKFRDSYGEMDCQPGTMEENPEDEDTPPAVDE